MSEKEAPSAALRSAPPAYADPNFRYDEKTMSYHRIAEPQPAAATITPTPQLPCPVCGGEAIHAIDILERTIITERGPADLYRDEAIAIGDLIAALAVIPALYEGLSAEGCATLDREWSRQRGYILPADGTSTLSRVVGPVQTLIFTDPPAAQSQGDMDAIEESMRGALAEPAGASEPGDEA